MAKPVFTRRQVLTTGTGLIVVNTLSLAGCGGGGANAGTSDATSSSAPPAPASLSAGSGDALWDAAYTARRGSLDAAIWLATDGLDSNPGTQAAPFATMGRALSKVTPNGLIVVKDGQYVAGESGWINDHFGTVPSGVRVFAQNPFKARISSNSSQYDGAAIVLERATGVWIDGIVIDRASAQYEYAINLGNNNTLSRCIVKMHTVSQYGGAVACGSGCVVEDVHAFGAGRYMFYSGSGGNSVAVGNNVLRRCVSHLAFNRLQEPSASFSFYGSNDADYAGVANMLYANCYEIDSPALYRGDPDATKWAAFYCPKAVRNVRFVGCGVINAGATYGGFRTDNFGSQSVQLASYSNCFVAGLAGSAGSGITPQGFSASSSTGTNPASDCTVFNAPAGFASNVPTTRPLTSGTIYPVRKLAGSGAEQRYAVGKLLSRWGDAGFDAPQINLPLWPFPYESVIASFFAEIVPRPGPAGAFYGPANSINPFVSASFTRRVWESCGNAQPADFY